MRAGEASERPLLGEVETCTLPELASFFSMTLRLRCEVRLGLLPLPLIADGLQAAWLPSRLARSEWSQRVKLSDQTLSGRQIFT